MCSEHKLSSHRAILFVSRFNCSRRHRFYFYRYCTLLSLVHQVSFSSFLTEPNQSQCGLPLLYCVSIDLFRGFKQQVTRHEVTIEHCRMKGAHTTKTDECTFDCSLSHRTENPIEEQTKWYKRKRATEQREA